VVGAIIPRPCQSKTNLGMLGIATPSDNKPSDNPAKLNSVTSQVSQESGQPEVRPVGSQVRQQSDRSQASRKAGIPASRKSGASQASSREAHRKVHRSASQESKSRIQQKLAFRATLRSGQSSPRPSFGKFAFLTDRNICECAVLCELLISERLQSSPLALVPSGTKDALDTVHNQSLLSRFETGELSVAEAIATATTADSFHMGPESIQIVLGHLTGE
jgi:hypothetical protein